MPRPTQRSHISPFQFRKYLPGSGETGVISFQPHITDFSLSSSPTWNEEYDMGRADPVMMYGNYNKNMSVSFIVIATFKDEADEIYTDLNSLGMLTYPIHKPGAGYNAPHVMFEIGTFISGIGVITALDYHWTGETPWLGTPSRPLITEVQLSIKILTDSLGNRPTYDLPGHSYMGK